MLFGNWPKLTLGRVGAIPVRLDATFVLVPIFLLNGLSLRLVGENWPAIASGIVGIFLSILLHELGHALTARFHRVGVSEIVVGGFYGYASVKGQAVPRSTLIRILAAGPLANLVIFLALWAALSGSPVFELGTRGPMAAGGGAASWLMDVARMLALVNLVMFVFNLLPAFPLDGGRILGHLLDRVVSAQTSRRIVSGLSILAGAAMILLGLGASTILAIIGLMVVGLNLRRFRRRRARRPNV